MEFGESEWNLVAASMLPFDRGTDEVSEYWAKAFPVKKGAWIAAEDTMLVSILSHSAVVVLVWSLEFPTHCP